MSEREAAIRTLMKQLGVDRPLDMWDVIASTSEYLNPDPLNGIMVDANPDFEPHAKTVNPRALMMLLTQLGDMKDDWPVSLGERLQRLEFDGPRGSLVGSAGNAYYRDAPLDISFNAPLLTDMGLSNQESIGGAPVRLPQIHEQMEGRTKYHGPMDLVMARSTPAHEAGHTILNSLFNSMMYGDREDLPAAARAKHRDLVQQMTKDMYDMTTPRPKDMSPFDLPARYMDPYGQTFPTRYAEVGFHDTIDGMVRATRETQIPDALPWFHQFQEPWAESVANLEMMDDAVTNSVIERHGINPDMYRKQALQELRRAPTFELTEKYYPQLKEFGGVAPNVALGVAGIAGIPLARRLLPKSLHRAYDAGVVGGSIGGLPGAAIGAGGALASQLLF
jgi:hypothetical protein